MKITIAMSGGVDSSVAAKILKDEGHEVIGLFLKLWNDPTSPRLRGTGPTSPRLRGTGPTSLKSSGTNHSCSIKENRCCDYEALEDARAVANKLNIPFYVINAQDEFKRQVVNYFLDEYKNLRTPNPCVVCNHKIKFGLLLKRAVEIGCDYLATGHYARIVQDNSGISNIQFPISNEIPNSKLERLEAPKGPLSEGAISYKLKAGIDKTKDQSYMLYHLNQKQLSHILFPLGEMTKKEVRALAEKWNLPVKEKPESQEICFFADKDYREFLKRYLPAKYFTSGKIVDKEGNILGEHSGLINYTIGQRKGVNQELGMVKSGQDDKQPLYVVGFEVKKNQLIVGQDKDVYSKEMIVSNLNWTNPLVLNSLTVKIRYRHAAVACKIIKEKLGTLVVVFDQPQRAVTPGQSAVFYLADEVVGGGVIE